MLKYLVPLAVFVALGVFLWSGLGRNPGDLPSPLIGKEAPTFKLPSLQDPAYAVDSAELRGRPYVLNVWGTWCVGCRHEHPVLLQIAQRRQVPIIGLAWKDDPEAARQWLVQLGNPYDAVADDRDGRVAIDWGVYGAPETYLVGADGRVLYKHIAPLTLEIWEQEFEPRLAEARGTGAGT
jgi:cytochrome c biogenesis protein CcmG/thiol:disulfide interchange protein DsbE